MNLVPDREKQKPGYPTLEEYALNRRAILKRIAKFAGMIAVAGVGVVSAGNQRPRTNGGKAPARATDTLDVARPKDSVSSDSLAHHPAVPGGIRPPETMRLPGDRVSPRHPYTLARKPGAMLKPAHGNNSSRCTLPGDSTKSTSFNDTTDSIHPVAKTIELQPPTGGVPVPPVMPDTTIPVNKRKR
jgi:hypothetical protein